jgi:hypothetical protein
MSDSRLVGFRPSCHGNSVPKVLLSSRYVGNTSRLTGPAMKASNMVSNRIKRLEKQVGPVMADPSLNDEQKYRATKRIFAEIDLHAALKDTLIPYQKFFDAVLRLTGLDLKAKDDYYKKVVRGLLQECLDLETKFSTRLWQCGKLHIFAPGGEVGVLYRVVLSVGLLLLSGILLPANRFCLRAMLAVMRSKKEDT